MQLRHIITHTLQVNRKQYKLPLWCKDIHCELIIRSLQGTQDACLRVTTADLLRGRGELLFALPNTPVFSLGAILVVVR